MGVQIVGASFDSVAANAAFAARQGIDFPLLCDSNRALGRAYGACRSSSARAAHRITYVIDPEGRIERSYRPADPATHAQQVLRDLQERGESQPAGPPAGHSHGGRA